LPSLERQFFALPIVDVVGETEDAHSIVFEVPAEDRALFTYKPGQFLTLHLPIGEKGLDRCYSLSSAPGVDATMKVTVKRVSGGIGSNWICDNCRPGMTIDVLAPAGVFTPRAFDGDFLMFAGGSGITPVVSIIKSALAHGKGRVNLVYANRDQRSVIFGNELKELASAHPDRLIVIHWLESVQGLPNVEQLAALVRPWRQAEAFICGPEPFMQTVKAALTSLDCDSARVHLERFVSLPGASVEVEAVTSNDAEPDLVDLTVELDGTRHHLEWPPAQHLLDVLLDAGLEAPFSCRLGACSACMCHLESGEVTLDQNTVLERDELARGWILACQAKPASAAVVISYEAQC